MVGTSPTSFAEAARSVIAHAPTTVRHMDWFDVVDEDGPIMNGQVAEFEVTHKVRSKIEW